MNPVTVVTVLYRAADQVLEWGAALAAAGADAPGVRVIAVDNASGDDTVARLRASAPWIEVIERQTNDGFAVGCNVGIAEAGPDDVIVLLNPDVAVDSEFITRVATLEWDDGLAAVGPQVTGADGETEQSARRFPSPITGLFGRTSLFSRLLPSSGLTKSQLLADPSRGTQTVDWVSGACLIAPAARFRETGGLDEGFWMYWEDADWCKRATALGRRVEYRPDLKVTHQQGSSSATLKVRTTIEFHRSAARYYRLHVAFSRIDALAVHGILMARAYAKLSVAWLRGARG